MYPTESPNAQELVVTCISKSGFEGLCAKIKKVQTKKPFIPCISSLNQQIHPSCPSTQTEIRRVGVWGRSKERVSG
jgi:hypothetical protein